jgi:DNA-binding CsgD family transcriptional regulator
MKKRQEMYANFLAQGGGDKLTPREEKVIRMIADGKSFEEVGVQFAVTRERIRQIADKVSRKIARIARDQEAQKLRDERLKEFKTKDLKGLQIDDLQLSVKAYNGLLNAGITHISQLAEITEAELLRTKNFGRKSLNEIKEILTQVGLRLKSSSAPLGELNGTQRSDLETVVAGIKKLPEEEAREVSLCLLTLLLPFTLNNEGATNLLRHFRDRLLG